MAKYKVRSGFVVHIDSKMKDEATGEEIIVKNMYIGGQTVDLEDAVAVQHMHKLEAADKDAEELAETVSQQPISGTDEVTA